MFRVPCRFLLTLKVIKLKYSLIPNLNQTEQEKPEGNRRSAATCWQKFTVNLNQNQNVRFNLSFSAALIAHNTDN